MIRDADGEEVVAVIELLSPTNKVRHRDAYLQKRAVLLDSPAHLVEIDLLRQGRPLPPADDPAAGLPPGGLVVTASRAEARPAVDLFAVPLRGPLPVIPVPLRRGEIVPFDLRAVQDRIYADSVYERSLYRRPPAPPLSPADAAWAAGVLVEAGVPLPPGFPPDPAGSETAPGD